MIVISPLRIPLLFYVALIDKEVTEAAPDVSFTLTNILLLESFDDDCSPNTHLNVPLLPVITPPSDHPGFALLGVPDPEYAWNMSAHPFVALNPVTHALLSGIQTLHPA